MTPKAFYRTYLADDHRQPMNEKLIELVKAENPSHVFEFGCGTGKNLVDFDCVVAGLDVSFLNIQVAKIKHDLPFLILGDEYHLGHLGAFDVVFTCSVLDHIEEVDKIIDDLKRMASKAVFLLETVDVVGRYYFPHRYSEDYRFTKLDFSWTGEDGATYHIWKWKPNN